MFTNTYTPHVGGVAKSVSTQVEWLREQGHSCLVVAPKFAGTATREEGIIRVPAIENFNQSGFSLRLPISTKLSEAIELFEPEIVHSHHPFLLGDSALRTAREYEIPLIFTHHTRYEDYVHYIIPDSENLERLAIDISITYCNFTDKVIAPSESIEKLILDRGVTVPVDVIPTGIDPAKFANADPAAFRKEHKIEDGRFLLGHVGRLAKEKNLEFLVDAVKQFLSKNTSADFLLVGEGPMEEELRNLLRNEIENRRVILPGKLSGKALASAYAAMDLFLFSSKSETQGMVLAEAMTLGIPVIALDASGAREIVTEKNGTLLPEDASTEAFVQEIDSWCRKLKDSTDLESLRNQIKDSIHEFTLDECMKRMIGNYEALISRYQAGPESNQWERFLNRCEAEWDLLSQKTEVALNLFKDSDFQS